MDTPDKDPTALPKPKRGILKKGSSRQSVDFEEDDGAHHNPSARKEFHFDEENIQETYHPANKEYGHMKIDEPNTPYHYYSDDEGRSGVPGFEADSLTARLEEDPEGLPKAMQMHVGENSDDCESMTEEEKVKNTEFKSKRRAHYNEFLAVQMMRQRMADEGDDDDDDEGGPSS